MTETTTEATSGATTERGVLEGEELTRLLGLMKSADSVELKLTVPESNQRSALAALQIDPLDA